MARPHVTKRVSFSLSAHLKIKIPIFGIQIYSSSNSRCPLILSAKRSSLILEGPANMAFVTKLLISSSYEALALFSGTFFPPSSFAKVWRMILNVE